MKDIINTKGLQLRESIAKKQPQKIFTPQNYVDSKHSEQIKKYVGSFDDYVNNTFHLNNEMIECRKIKCVGNFIRNPERKTCNIFYIKFE